MDLVRTISKDEFCAKSLDREGFILFLSYIFAIKPNSLNGSKFGSVGEQGVFTPRTSRNAFQKVRSIRYKLLRAQD